MILKHIPNPKKSARKNTRIRKLGDYILNSDDKGKEKCTYWNTLNIDCVEKDDVKEEILGLAKCSTRSKDPIDHWVLSFKEGEEPRANQVDQMVKMIMEDFGLKHHQCLYAVHSDTDNLHIHLMINRVCPLTQKVAQVNDGLYKIAAQKVVARICAELNFLQEDNDLYEMGEDGKATLKKERSKDHKGKNWEAERAAEDYGEESISARAKRELTDIFDEAESWQELHKRLGDLGYRYERKGSGAIVWFDDVVIKASDASGKRNSSFGKLKRKLGEFEASDRESVVFGQKKKAAPMADDLREIAWLDYTQLRSGQRKQKKDAQAKLNQRHREEFDELLGALREERTSLCKGSWRGQGMALNAMRAVLAAEQGARKAALKERQKREKEELRRRYPPFPKFRDWLAGEYDQDTAVLFDTEKMIYSQGQAFGQVPDLRDLEYSHGFFFNSTTFRRIGTGETVFVDRGDRVSLASLTEGDIKLWLEYSTERYRGKFQIQNADPDFIRRAGRIAAEHGLRFELNGPDRETIELFNRARREGEEELKPDWMKGEKHGAGSPAGDSAGGQIGVLWKNRQI